MCNCNCKKETHTQRMIKMFADQGACLEPIDFSTAQVGDTVRCLLNGDVEVKEPFYCHDEWPIEVRYMKDGKEKEEQYTTDGKLDIGHVKPSLIGFVDTDGKLCRTRPEPKIDWSKVAIDAPVERIYGNGVKEISHYGGMNSDNTFPMFWNNGKTSHTADGLNNGQSDLTYKLINTEDK